MPFTDSARLSTWAIVLGAALAGDGLYVGSSTLLVSGTALLLPALLVARHRRHVDGHLLVRELDARGAEGRDDLVVGNAPNHE
mgnify:CR=1 FL=1